MAEDQDPDREALEEELAAEMLEDLEELSGISIGEMLSDALDIPDFEEYPVYEEPTEDEPLDPYTPEEGLDTDEYFDALFDEIDVDADAEVDSYGDD